LLSGVAADSLLLLLLGAEADNLLCYNGAMVSLLL
jgi:hypothetical protein